MQINLYSEVFQSYMLSQFSGKLLELGLDTVFAKDMVKAFSTSLKLQDFDDECLKFERFLEFCEFIQVSTTQLYDEYYRFIFTDYGSALVQFRNKNNLTQKKCAKILKISPAYIGLFEKRLKHPTRKQYLKIKEALTHYAK